MTQEKGLLEKHSYTVYWYDNTVLPRVDLIIY